jgi:hypothetical protein
MSLNDDYPPHNHRTRDIKDPGECPACDEIHLGEECEYTCEGCGTSLVLVVRTPPANAECPICGADLVAHFGKGRD